MVVVRVVVVVMKRRPHVPTRTDTICHYQTLVRSRRRARRLVEVLRRMKMVPIGGKRLSLVAASFIAGSAVPTALVIADSGPPKAVFDEISVKRINIVEPGGKYRLVLANSERFPGL